MIRPSHIYRFSYFYPVGNTPAVCLTQALPPEQDATLLLLGCGDARSILFTAYAGAGTAERNLDFTCCDIEAEIIARNIVLLTLILADKSNSDVDKIWAIYNDLVIDVASLKLLRKHTKKLLASSYSLDEWHASDLGKVLRFTDSGSLSKVRDLWKFYSEEPINGHSFSVQQRKLASGNNTARDVKHDRVGDGTTLSGFPSAAPLSIAALDDVPQIYQHYWERQTTRIQTSNLEAHNEFNPMFGSLHDNLVMHYGTEPLHGYHLVTAYAPLAKDSPLKSSNSGSNLQKLLFAAKVQFKIWATAFRSKQSRLIIRFVVADALAFCHVLQHVQTHGDSTASHWYRDNWHFEPLNLDSKDYSRNATEIAPVQFDLIDTSNLVNHLGCFNLLVATAPLLSHKPTSTVSSEMLVLRGQDTDTHGQSFMCGDLATSSLLLGVPPVQYWTQMTATSTSDESMMAAMAKKIPNFRQGQSRSIVIWKKLTVLNTRGDSGTTSHKITFEPRELARFLYRTYSKMFKSENIHVTLRNMKVRSESLSRKPFEHYTRSSFAAFLMTIKRSCITDWRPFSDLFNELIQSQSSLNMMNMGGHYIQSFLLQLHRLELYTYDSFGPSLADMRRNLGRTPLKDWKDIPPILCVTLVVRRRKLKAFQAIANVKSTPACEMNINVPMGQNHFPDVQLGFGRIVPSGVRYSSNYSIAVTGDEAMWEGTSACIVSTMVPTWMMLSNPDFSTEVCFSLKSTPMVKALYMKDYGVFLKIHESTLASKDVYITRFPPNQKGLLSVSQGLSCLNTAKQSVSTQPASFGEAKSTISLTSGLHPLSRLTCRMNVLGTDVKELVQKGALVEVTQKSAYELLFRVDSRESASVILPLPLVRGGKTRIARKSLYIEFEAAIASPTSLPKIAENHFASLIMDKPTLQNLHYTTLDKLPLLDLNQKSKMTWLNTHLASMFSKQDTVDRELPLNARLDATFGRANFKDSLFSILMQYAGQQCDKRYTVFGINNQPGSQDGTQVLIYGAGLRLDVSNQAVVFDAVAVLLTNANRSETAPLLARSGGIKCVSVNDNELLLWKHAIPAFAERCRTWTHNEHCEYQAAQKMPASLAIGEQVVCSCGIGKFPDGFTMEDKSLWKDVSKLGVRVAISPCYLVAFMEKTYSRLDNTLKTHISPVAKDKENLHADIDECNVCGKKGSFQGVPLLKCSACKKVGYCSKECQSKDWKEGGHQTVGKTLRAL